MPNETKNKILHISITTVVAIILFTIALLTGVLSFGREAGGFESDVKDNKEDITEIKIDVEGLKTDVKIIPALEEAVKTLKADVKYTRAGVDNIIDLLIKKN